MKKQRLNITDKILASNSVSDLATSLCKAKSDISRAINRLLQLKLVGERKAKQGDDMAVNRRYYSLPGGNTRGELLEPLYPKAPEAAVKNQELYALLAIIDIIRTGKPRELKHAKELFANKIKELYS